MPGANQFLIELKAETASFKASMNEAVTILKGFEKQAGFISKSLGRVFNVGIGVGALYAVKQLGAALGNLAQRGDAILDLEESFQRLGGSVSSLNAAKSAVLGVVSSADLMKVANQGLLSGLPGFNEKFGELAQLGAQVGQALGISATEGIQKVVEAIRTGKESQLAQIGIFVTATDKAGKQKQAMEQLGDASKRLAPIQYGAAEAFDRLGIATEEFTDAIGKLLSNSDLLRDFFDALANGASLTAQILDFYFSDSARAKMARNVRDIESLTEAVQNAEAKIAPLQKSLNEMNGVGLGAMRRASLQSDLARAEREKADAQAELNKLLTEQNNLIDESRTAEAVAGLKRMITEKKRAAAEFREELEKINKQLSSDEAKEWAEGFRVELDKILGSGDLKGFDKALAGYREAFAKQLREAWGDAFSKADPAAQSRMIALDEQRIEREVASWSEKRGEAAEELAKKELENAKKLGEELKKAHEESVKFWETAFENAITGVTFDMKDAFKQIAVGFAAEIMAAMSGSLGEGVDSPKGLGKALGKNILDWVTGAGDAAGLGRGVSANDAYAAGYQGPAMENGQFTQAATAGEWTAAGVTSIASIVSAAISAKDLDKQNKDNRGTGAAVGAGAGAAIGAFFGPIGMAIGASLGGAAGGELGKLLKWGSQNPDTQARHAFANFIEEGFDKLQSIAFYDMESGKLKTLRTDNLNFLEGPRSRFNQPGWGERMNALPNAGIFGGISQGFEELLGLSEDVGGQIAAYLMENLGGSIDNLRLMVYQLGVSFEDMEKALVEAGRTGEMTWHEVEVAIQGVTEAFKPGLEAFADVKGAVEEIVDSGGRGMVALKGLKDLAKEVEEAGGKTLEDFKKKMLEAGVGPEEANAIYESLKARGIQTTEDIMNATDRTLGAITADIYAKSAKIAEAWDKAKLDFEDQNKQLEKLRDNMNALPDEINSKVKLTFESELDENTRAVINSGATGVSIPVTANALGGVINSPTLLSATDGLHLAGEAGPEAILPLATVNGRLGVRAVGGFGKGAAGLTVNIDARGAAPGVEHKIWQVMKDISEQTTMNAIDKMMRARQRGGRGAGL